MSKRGSRRGRPAKDKKKTFREFRASNRPTRTSRGTTTKFDDSGRESGIRAAKTTTLADKKKSLEQSIGSLDRRINKAVSAGNLDLAKDLRSRQNKFVKNLGYFNATNTANGVARTSSGSIIRTSDGSPVLTSAGLAAFNKTVDRDFLDPTRKLVNENPEAYAKMYPIANQLRQGLPGSRFLKGLGGVDDKKQRFTDDKMPGERYALDKDFGAGTGPEIMDDEIIADDFDKSLDVAPDAVPLPGVTIRQKPQPDASDLSLLELLFDANRNEPGIQVFNTNPTPGEDRSLNLAPNLFKNIGSAFDADPNTPGIQIFNTNPSGNKNVNMQVKEPSGPMMQVDENPLILGTQVSGDNFANQVANNAVVMKENIANAPNLNTNQKQVLINEVDKQMTQFQPTIDQTSILDVDPGQSMFPAATTNALTSANPASEAAALEVLNSLDNNQSGGFSLADLFDANPDEAGFQLFNFNRNR